MGTLDIKPLHPLSMAEWKSLNGEAEENCRMSNKNRRISKGRRVNGQRCALGRWTFLIGHSAVLFPAYYGRMVNSRAAAIRRGETASG